jgi:hypothetical protein
MLQVLVNGWRPRKVAAGEARHAHRVDKSCGPPVHGHDALIGGVWGNEEDHVELVVRGGLAEWAAFLRRQVRENQAVDPRRRCVPTKVFGSVGEHRVHVSHEQQRGVALGAEVFGGTEGVGEGHAVGQGLRAGALNGAPLRQGVTEGHAQFDEVDASSIERPENRPRGFGGWEAVGEEKSHGLLVSAL